jgi:GTPase SAR1 family protein
MVAHGKQQIELSLWDTAGQEDYDRLRPLSYPESDVVLMCYSVDSVNSLDNLTEKWHPELVHFLENVPKIVVGLKTDLRDEAVGEDREQFVPYERVCRGPSFCRYFFCNSTASLCHFLIAFNVVFSPLCPITGSTSCSLITLQVLRVFRQDRQGSYRSFPGSCQGRNAVKDLQDAQERLLDPLRSEDLEHYFIMIPSQHNVINRHIQHKQGGVKGRYSAVLETMEPS